MNNTAKSIVPDECFMNEKSPKRQVILHYHLFKNAGTSLDSAFKSNLSAFEWLTREFPSAAALNSSAVSQWISEEKNGVCFSSHTAELPVPEIDGIEIFPVIFIRHPIDRIVSAYTFESKQNAQSFGSTLARNTGLAGYIETRLSIKSDHQCRDFHAHRLAAMYPSDHGDIGTRAMLAFENLPFIGLVEKFGASLDALNEQLHQFGMMNLHLSQEIRNVSRGSGQCLEQKLSEIRSLVGNDLYNVIEKSNSNDLALFDKALAKYQ